MIELTSRTALVTGASRGIGRATALVLASRGARVVVHFANAKAEADAVVAEICKAGGAADAVQADLATPQGADVLVKATKALVGGRLDILVANAGVAGPASIAEQTVEAFDRLYAVNQRAPFLLVQGLLPLLGEGSNVILLSSLAARATVGDLAAYASTKGAIDTLVRFLAAELGPKGIRVNAVAPGVIATDMSSFAKDDASHPFILGMQALKRIGQPDDVSGVVAFLASDDARWITGTTIPVDGGSKL